MLNERNQLTKTNIMCFHFYETPRVVKLREKRDGGCQELGKEKSGELLFNRTRVLILQDEMSSGESLHNNKNVLNPTEFKPLPLKNG